MHPIDQLSCAYLRSNIGYFNIGCHGNGIFGAKNAVLEYKTLIIHISQYVTHIKNILTLEPSQDTQTVF